MENQDKRMEQIMQDITDNALGLNDTFQFGCRECGKCCKNREDILLTTRDIFNIAKHLGRTVEYVIDRYCEMYIGQNSRIPIVRLKPVGPEKVCPLLLNKKCIVHKVKPIVCALYPLGRSFTMPNLGRASIRAEDIVPQYFIQSAHCGTLDISHTVREWLEYFDIPAEDDFYRHWTEATSLSGDFVRALEDAHPTKKTLEMVWGAIYHSLYINYNTDDELLPQFLSDYKKLRSVFYTLGKVADSKFGGMPDAG